MLPLRSSSEDQIKCGFDDWSFSAAGLGHGECEKITAPTAPTAKGRPSTSPGTMDVLECHHLQLRFAVQGGDRLHRGPSRRQGGDRWHGVVEGGAAQVAVVVGGLGPDRRVDHQLDLAGADDVLNIGPSISLYIVAVVSGGPGYGLAARPGWSAVNLRKM